MLSIIPFHLETPFPIIHPKAQLANMMFPKSQMPSVFGLLTEVRYLDSKSIARITWLFFIFGFLNSTPRDAFTF